MSGFFSRLFGGRKGDPGRGEVQLEAVEYKGFRIRPAPFRAGSEFQTAGVIQKEFPDGLQEHRFIRAEKHASSELAADFAVSKGRQIIDEQGDRIFGK